MADAATDEDFAEQWTLNTHGPDVVGTGHWHRLDFIADPGLSKVALRDRVAAKGEAAG